MEELLKAHKRGVDVRIVVDEYSRENNAFEYLKSNGVKIKYDGNKTSTHAKLIIVDGKIIVLGSTNLSYYGLEQNNEVDLMVIDEKAADYLKNTLRSFGLVANSPSQKVNHWLPFSNFFSAC